MNQYYHLCSRNVGKNCRITDRSGRVHVGRITRVSNSKVFIQPSRSRGFGYGYGFYGGYYPWGGYGYGIALGAIVGIAIAGLFFF